ncbi:hypothetical protein [Kitasatospora sp. NPDC057015]|uniref:hypothetical protein n=1 Tax=Kitasatospora sp. NPDC057015 TaxID=3346001 RepID=UPI003636AD65
MTLSRLAAQFAAEINQQDWSDAHIRADRAGHRRDRDRPGSAEKVLSPAEAEKVKINAAWVTAQVLGYNDSNFDPHEFFKACGVSDQWLWNRDGQRSGFVAAGLRTRTGLAGEVEYQVPGMWGCWEGAPIVD